MNKLPKVSAMPKWLANLPADARLSAKDVAAAIGYASVGSLNSAIQRGRFPDADAKHKGFSGAENRFWLARTIRNELRRRAAA